MQIGLVEKLKENFEVARRRVRSGERLVGQSHLLAMGVIRIG